MQRDRSGHYVVPGTVNGVEAEFLLDTGATDVAIPPALAERLKLRRGPEVEIRTASDIIPGYLVKRRREPAAATRPFIPDEKYVEGLLARAEAALTSVRGVWRAGPPVELRDRAGLFHTVRHIAYCVRAATPQDENLTLYAGLAMGLGDRYGLTEWRTERTVDRVAEWVLDPQNADYVKRRAKLAAWHANIVYGCARHEVRVAAASALIERGATHAEIGQRLRCGDRQLRRLLDAIGAPRETRPRWSDDEIEILRNAVRPREGKSERAACFEVAATLGREPPTVHMQWKRLKRRDEAEADAARATVGVS